MALRDDFVVAPWRDELESLDNFWAVQTTLVVWCVVWERVLVQRIAHRHRLACKRRRDNGRAHTKISSDAHDDKPLSLLWHPEICHVNYLGAEVVAYYRPLLAATTSEARRRPERMPNKRPRGATVCRQQTRYVLQNEGGWLQLIEEPSDLAKEVSSGRLEAVVVPQGGVVLARRTCQQDVARNAGDLGLRYVGLHYVAT